jgi:hypothetical protein
MQQWSLFHPLVGRNGNCWPFHWPCRDRSVYHLLAISAFQYRASSLSYWQFFLFNANPNCRRWLVGGYFGGRLAEAGRDIPFLLRPLRARQLGQNGLRIISPHGDVNLTPKVVGAGEISSPYDIILLGVKAYALDKAINYFAPAVGPETMVFPVLNGMRHIELFGAAVRRRRGHWRYLCCRHRTRWRGAHHPDCRYPATDLWLPLAFWAVISPTF